MIMMMVTMIKIMMTIKMLIMMIRMMTMTMTTKIVLHNQGQLVSVGSALKLFASYENASSAGAWVGWYKSQIQYNGARFANIKEL